MLSLQQQLLMAQAEPATQQTWWGMQLDAAAIADWPQRMVHFGASVVSVCRGMHQRAVATLFASGFLCVRAFVPATGAPTPYFSSCVLNGQPHFKVEACVFACLCQA